MTYTGKCYADIENFPDNVQDCTEANCPLKEYDGKECLFYDVISSKYLEEIKEKRKAQAAGKPEF